MTTLPQTTSIRIPRQQAAIQGAAPSSQLAIGGAAGMTGADIWRVIRGNLWLIISFLAVSIVAGFGINKLLEVYMPRYTAIGTIEIANTQPLVLTQQTPQNIDTGSLSIDQNTQALLLSSPQNDALLTQVLQNVNSDMRKTSWYQKFKSVQAAKTDFNDNYRVTAPPGTRLIRVEFTCAKAAEAQTIVEEIVDTHLRNQMELTSNQRQDHTVLLNNLRIKYQMKLTDDRQQLSKDRQDLNVDGGGLGRVGIKELELSELVRAQTELQLTTQKASAEYDYLVQTFQSGNEPAQVTEYVENHPDIRQAKAQKEELELNVQQVLLTYGEKSTQYTKAQALLGIYQKRLDDLTADLRAKARVQILEQHRQQVAASKHDLELMDAHVNALKTDLGELSNQMAAYLVLVDEEKGLRELVRQVTDQLENSGPAESQNGQMKVEWQQRPGLPTNLSFPKIQYVMSLSILCGLALSLAIAFLRELTDQTVRTPRDIERIGQLKMLGMVTDENDDPQAAGARLPLVIFDAPHSVTAEQLRQVRTRLQHTASLDTTRSIMVTSPAPGDGKTTIACNLAAGLALNGRRILLVDSNFRRPEIHKIFALGNEHGFSDVLNGAIPFDEVVQETPVPNLAVMTSGPKPINATEMFESQLLIDFIERALEEFDHVIFDSGPMMVVSESAAMAPRVDGVVTVVRARNNSRGLLQRMCEEMRRTKAEQLGVVLNAVRVQGGGYYARNIKAYYEYQNT